LSSANTEGGSATQHGCRWGGCIRARVSAWRVLIHERACTLARTHAADQVWKGCHSPLASTAQMASRYGTFHREHSHSGGCFAVGRECSACLGAEGASGVAGWRHRWTASAVAVPARGAAGARCADTASAPTAPAVGPWAAPGRGHSTLCQISLALALGDDAVGRCPRMARRVSAPNESGTPGGAHTEHRSTAMIAVVPLEFSVP